MRFLLKSPDQIGSVVRAVRKAQGLRQDDAAGYMKVSENFLGKVENSVPTVQWAKLFSILDGLGIHVVLDVDDRLADKVLSRLRTDESGGALAPIPAERA